MKKTFGFSKWFFVVAVLVCMMISSTTSAAEKWPTRPITIIVGFSAGSGTDLGARYFAQALEKQLGVSVIVENVPGSGSWRAWNQIMYNTEPDGYTIGLVNHNFAKGHYNVKAPRKETLKDIQLLVNQVVDPNVLAIRTNENRFKDLPSFIEYAQKNEIMIAVQSVGITDGDSTCAEWFNKTYGTKVVQVPVNSAAEGRNMFLAGDADVYFSSVGDSYRYHKNGEMKVICQFAEKRSELLADIPTMSELDLKSYVGFSVRGYFYPKAVPAGISNKLCDAMMLALEDKDYKDNILKMGMTPMPLRGKDFVDLLESQLTNGMEVWNVTAPAYK